MTMTLAEALQSLDPNNADQWTANGFPKMETLQELTGDLTLTRAQVNQVAPNFSRESMTLGATEDAPEPSGQTALGDTAEPLADDAEDEAAIASDDADDEAVGDDAPDEAQLDEDIASLTEAIAHRQAVLNDWRGELDRMIARKDELIAARERIHTPRSDQEERMRFIRSQAEQRAKRAGDMANARELLKRSAVVGAVPLDLALAARPRQSRALPPKSE